MKVLAVETATAWQSLALLEEEQVVARAGRDAGGAHAKWVIQTVDDLLRGANLTLRELDGLSVSVGPGSFTGLRVGIATMLGFRAVTNLPVAAVPTLEALAWNVREPGAAVCPMIKGRAGETYWAVYRWISADELAEVVEPRVDRVEAIPEAFSEPIVPLGDGWLAYREQIRRALGERQRWIRETSEEAMRPSAVSVGRAGLRRLKRGEVQPLGAAPFYVQRSDAEINWERSHRSTSTLSRDEKIRRTVRSH